MHWREKGRQGGLSNPTKRSFEKENLILQSTTATSHLLSSPKSCQRTAQCIAQDAGTRSTNRRIYPWSPPPPPPSPPILLEYVSTKFNFGHSPEYQTSKSWSADRILGESIATHRIGNARLNSTKGTARHFAYTVRVTWYFHTWYWDVRDISVWMLQIGYGLAIRIIEVYYPHELVTN